MHNSDFDQIRKEFLQEAKNAPRLFNDLSKVEKYIAESYKTRALIELIQNADDAKATNFGLHDFEGGLIVGNNGHEFTIEDVEALCRSGSSNKQRGRNTIGYRGIGFKSVVNFTKRVLIFSGKYNFYFDREKTKSILNISSDVPLIRVPHPLDDSYRELQNTISHLVNEHHYSTIFVFQDIIKELSIDELSEFDRSSLLFLHNLRNINIDFQNIKRHISVEQKRYNLRTTILIKEEENIDEWEIDSNNSNDTNDTNKIDSVAYKRHSGMIIPALPKESVIHSFTPTFEFSGAYIKINGDFTTDPSRKTIDFDELSKLSFENTLNVIANSISSILLGDISRTGFFSPFINIQSGEMGRFKPLLFKGLTERLSNFLDTRLKPEWLNYTDYENICCDGIKPIKRELLTTYPELFVFLDAINIKTLTLDEVIKRLNSTKLTALGNAEILSKIIKQNRYDLNSSKIEIFKNLRLFPVNGEIIEGNKIDALAEVENDFLILLNSLTDLNDINYFFKRLGLKTDDPTTNTDKIQLSTTSIQPNQNIESEIQMVFKSEPAIKKWRSAEQNSREYLNSLNGVLSVTDVSQANLGYDLEILLKSGKKIYVEIKSVSSFSEPFKITNNEYSSAHSFGENYFIALVINDAPFKMRFIPNPISILSFEKKCEKWSWFCEKYADEMKELNQIPLFK